MERTKQLLLDYLLEDLVFVVISYITTKEENWVKIVNAGAYELCLNIPDRDIERCMYTACKNEYIDMIHYFIDRCSIPINYNLGLLGAYRSGNKYLINLMIKLGADCWDSAFEIACENGNIDLIREIIPRVRNMYSMNLGLMIGCIKKNFSMIDLTLIYGANDWNLALFGACKGGNQVIIDCVISKGVNDWNYGLHGAVSGNHLEIAKNMISRGATELNGALKIACVCSHKILINYLCRHGATECRNCDKSIQMHMTS